MTKLPIEIDNFRKLRVEYHLVDSCNLNCKACSHYSNLKSTKKEIPKTLDKIEKDFRKIWELTNSGDPKYVDKITLMGGEPLLYKNIIPAIDLVKSLFPHDYDEGPVQLITNGILLPRMKPDFFECLRRNKIRVCMSMYNHDYTGKKIDYDSLFKILDDERIDWYWYTVNTLEDKQFHTKWLHTNFDENYKEYAQDCHWRQSCTQLVDNKVYLCPLIAYWKYFDAEFEGQHNFVITDEDSIDLDKINSFEELQVERDKVPHFCGYCKGHNAVNDEWGITTRTIDEYVDDNIGMDEEENINDKLKSYINDPQDIQNIINLAVEYDRINQTASALSYYERVIKFSDNDDIVYEMLIKCAQCLYRQGNRQYSVRGLYLHAMALIPTRPEAYFFLSDMYQTWCLKNGSGPTGNGFGWQEAYTTAICGLEYIKNEKNVSGAELLYPGNYGLIFNKAVSAWWIGRIEESKNIFLDLKNNYVMNDTISQAVNDNLNNTNFYDF